MTARVPLAAERLVADVVRTTGRVLRLEATDSHALDQVFVLDEETAVAQLADQVQEFLDEEISGGWPFCPEHATHITAVVSAGTAVWRCPRGETVARIGDLPASVG